MKFINQNTRYPIEAHRNGIHGKVLKESQEVKFPEKRQQLLKLLEEMGEEDNQILAIYKLKK